MPEPCHQPTSRGLWLLLAVLGAAAALLLAAGPAWAVGDGSKQPTLRDEARGTLRGPGGWTVWCRESPQLCHRDAPATVSLDTATSSLIARVFHTVHAMITPEQEPPGQDVWRVVEGHGHGDCEDYALTWREALVASGLPRGALDVAVAVTEQGEIHAVLAVHTDHGTLILDNRQARPLPWTSLPYAWLALEPVSQGPAPWLALPDHQLIGRRPPLTAEGRVRP